MFRVEKIGLNGETGTTYIYIFYFDLINLNKKKLNPSNNYYGQKLKVGKAK